MLFGSPLRAEISRSGSASPDARNADSSCEECTTDLTRYGSRPGVLCGMVRLVWKRRHIMPERFAARNRLARSRKDFPDSNGPDLGLTQPKKLDLPGERLDHRVA